MENEKTIEELLTSLTNSIEDIREHPTQAADLPSNLEIIVKGINGESGLKSLFSPQIDSLIFGLFDKIQNNDFDAVLQNADRLKDICSVIFGKGSFEGPVSTAVLNTIQSTMTSYKYNTMKSCLGKSVTQLKKIKLILRNLKQTGKRFKNDSETYNKYMTAVRAIKQVLKFAAVIYRNRRIVNRRVFEGINNIVHEDVYIDECCTGMEDF